MCCCFALTIPESELGDHFGIDEMPRITPIAELYPNQKIAVVGLKADGRRRGIAGLQWGLVPHWANDASDGPRPVNARAETVLSKPTFRESFQKRRCLVPATSYFEWRTEGKLKERNRIWVKDTPVFAFAGLWDTWVGPDGKPLATCCIITTSANARLSPIHNRMPVILERNQYDTWLNPSTPVDRLKAMCVPNTTQEFATAVAPRAPSKAKASAHHDDEPDDKRHQEDDREE